jgi:tetratricopeptide (TPR) repeat protein
MNEMLGNQYFMARNYLGAATVFQYVLKEDPTNINARKKLIIAFTQIGKYSKAVDLFSEFISENVDNIIETDPIKDDCPCPELVHSLEHLTHAENESFTTYQTLGILWLYCDIYKSIENFEKALELKPKDEKTNAFLVIIKKKLTEISTQNNAHHSS